MYGSAFHSCGADDEKSRSPYVLSLVLGRMQDTFICNSQIQTQLVQFDEIRDMLLLGLEGIYE